jgi:hypothetical protein
VSIRRVAVAVVTVALSVGVPAAWASQQGGTPDTTTTSSEQVRRVETTADLCTKDGGERPSRPTSATEWQAAFHGLRGAWTAGDQASSVRLADGRTLWLFGDTLQGLDASGGVYGAVGHRALAPGERPASTRMVHNTLVLEDGCLIPVTGSGGSSLIPDVDADTWYWPGHAVVDGTTVTMTATKVRRTGPTPWDFALVGDAIVTLQADPGALPVVRSVTEVHTGLRPTSVVWGAALVRHGGWTYVYGTRDTGRPLVFGKELYVARVRPGQEPRESAWRYWDGRRWQQRGDRAVAVRDAVGGVSASLSVDYDRERHEWVAVTKKDGAYGRDVVALTSEHPTGPWREQRLFSAPTDPDGVMRYTALAHPGIGTASGRLLVSVSRNDADAERVAADPTRYEPEFHEVTLR